MKQQYTVKYTVFFHRYPDFYHALHGHSLDPAARGISVFHENAQSGAFAGDGHFRHDFFVSRLATS